MDVEGTIEAAAELSAVREELDLMVKRLPAGDFSAEDRRRYGQLLAREQLLLIKAGRG